MNGDERLELTGLPHGGAAWLAALIALAAIAFIVLLYRKERELGRLQRGTLAALRLLALALVLWMLLDPRMVKVLELKRPATTFLLVDSSGSMHTADPYERNERVALEKASGLDLKEPRQRIEIALAAAERAGLVERLEQKNRLKVLAFDGATRALDGLKKEAFAPPGGDATRIGDALRSALKQGGSEPVAGIVLVTDGRSNAGEGLDRAAADVASLGIPIHAVIAGRTREKVNFAVSDLAAPETTRPGSPIRIQAQVELLGLREAVNVTLSREALKGGKKEDIETRKLEPRGPRSALNLSFTDVVQQAGTYRYVLKLEGRLPSETDLSDNQREVRVAAADEKCRVLLVAGAPNSENKFLRDFLTRDDGLQASCWLSNADPGCNALDGDVEIKDLPRTPDKIRAYDAVILLDPDPAALRADFLESLKDFVTEQGGGLAYVAGTCFAQSVLLSPSCATLRAILPVEPPPRAPSPRAYTRAWRPTLTVQGAEHPACRLADDSAGNLKAWGELRGMNYSAGVRQLKPAATMLLEREGEIIAAVQKSGAGNVLFLGTDDLKRSLGVREAYHGRFWGSVVRYLALGKRFSNAGEATLQADRDRYTIGEDVVFEASLTDGDRKPLAKDKVEIDVDLVDAAGQKTSTTRVNLPAVQDRPGWFAGRFRPAAPGKYAARVAGAPETAAGKAAFEAVPPTTEFEDPTPDVEALEELARRTGGRLYTLAEIGEVAQNIGDRSAVEVIGRSATTVWDSSAAMLLFGALLIVEWVLRKIWRLN